MAKNRTVRLPNEEAEIVEAHADGVSLNETARRSLVEAAEKRRADPEFQARLKRIMEQDRELLERLAKQ